MMLVITTCPEENASNLARALVDEKLVACVNILPAARSIYRWQGKVEEAEERLLLMKTQAELFDRLQRRVEELHSYDVPELIAFEIERGLPAYLDWVREVTE